MGSSFLKYFPVPKYLQFPAVGFDVSDGSVKYIELIEANGGIEVGKFGRRSFAEGELIKTLSAIQKQTGFSMVNVSIPEEESFFVRIRLPFIKTEEVRSAIELQIEEYIPYAANEVEFDFEILKTDPRPSGYLDVNVSALPKKTVNNYLDIFKNSNLIPTSMMIEADATSRATVPRGIDDAVMIVNTGRVNTVLSIVARGSVWFSYTFKFGGDILVKRLEDTFHITSEVAEKVKNEIGLSSAPGNQDVFGCLLPMVSSIRDETRKHLRYWSENREGFLMARDTTDIDRVILCGSQSIIPGLTNYLSTALDLKAVLANPWTNILNFDKYIPPITHRDSLEYTTAIGLALSSLK